MKVLTGHLTAHNKKAIKAILAQNLTEGRVSHTDYKIVQQNGYFEVIMAKMDRGLIPCPGSELRLSKYKATFII